VTVGDPGFGTKVGAEKAENSVRPLFPYFHKAIPEARREAVPGVRLCIDCQSKNDKADKISSSYNRRGSKDSQLG